MSLPDKNNFATNPAFFIFNSAPWKTECCGDCHFMCDYPGSKKSNNPELKECRESPPSVYLMPGITPLKQPVMNIVHQYPRLDPKYPACSRFKQKQKTENNANK